MKQQYVYYAAKKANYKHLYEYSEITTTATASLLATPTVMMIPLYFLGFIERFFTNRPQQLSCLEFAVILLHHRGNSVFHLENKRRDKVPTVVKLTRC